MDSQILRDVRDRSLALQRQTNAALEKLIGVLLRSGHEVARISCRQDIILVSKVSVEPGRLRGHQLGNVSTN
jgi:hypothetical protein